MQRIPEPELMDEPEQARAYAHADFAEPHQAFVERFHQCFPGHRPRQVLDLGCGAADITIRFARACPECSLTGVDGAAAMLVFAHEAITRADLDDRIELQQARLPETALPPHAFDTVISNSLLHHLHDPQTLWSAVTQYAAPGAAVFIMDLHRPDSRERAGAFVDEHAGMEPEILRRDFFNSLLAAFRPEEIREQLAQAGLTSFRVEAAGDRHIIVHGKMG
ncbi:methyltransferase type 12 [Sulfuricaulis limicola]|uniref:Methyltransferase type 12 n=1 Tax=Sulfuricaulis limicola TaxID=1620215 RepID=A0A1B4XDW7_9GAMM|nr:class I SAM-dependent methyltransferase [Sulfuricaulis limicola]BAV32986.1 methyltransferase type 12 [Sulfuricaulis limicola]